MKKKFRFLIDRRFCPDASALTVDGALRTRETDAGAFKLARRMQTLERAEEAMLVIFIEARAVVANGEHHRAVG